ncbi:probable cytochrome P450 6a14 [Halyomorpha halys]|uniref:probable cytochrome P450 6a14 n=1 Tax=Halyomorpha halys TaxID=286706 RepID=UPI0006D50439|nr:probable cytochrome P450 6a14 [Halyomorpha halys]
MFFILELLREYFFVWFIVIITALYYILTKTHGYWASLNVKYIPPLPLFGNSFSTALSITPAFKVQQEQYNYLKGQQYGGIWGFMEPKLLILDPQLIEQIMIKDFSCFTDRPGSAAANTTLGNQLGRHLVNENGNSWKTLRSKLSPVFSSGKLKTMIQQIMECSDVCVQHIDNKVAAGNALEVREEMAGFTMDVIGSCAFGLNINAMNDPNSKFKQLGQMMFKPSRTLKLRRALNAHFGFLLKLFSWRRETVSKETGGSAAFFINTVMSIVKYREENNFHRNDFIQLMMELRKEEEKQLKDGTISQVVMDDNTMASNAFVFLLAGFETTSTTLSYVLYELSTNPEIQDKVYKEVDNVLKKHKGEITWEGLSEMKYVELVITETLRKYPPIVNVARKSVRPYKIPNSDLELPKDSVVVIPIYSIHHDSKYYPDPEKFEPERFSEENKHRLVNCTFLPFGDGPRICIGLRFAKMEMKIAIAKLIMRYELKINSRTLTPLQYSAKTNFLVPIGGIWVDFIPRKDYQCNK